MSHVLIHGHGRVHSTRSLPDRGLVKTLCGRIYVKGDGALARIDYPVTCRTCLRVSKARRS